MNSEELVLIDLFCQHHSIELNFISAIKEYGLIEVIIVEEKEYFSAKQLSSVEKIIRLHYDLEINLEGIDVILNLLNQIEDYKRQLLTHQNRVAFFEK
ncbi:MAG: chaperone modulator CbpM [Flavobacterium sp.]